jgi:hypothetical protein
VLASICVCAVIPPGFYMKGPGMIAPCPVGEWKDGTGPAGNCTKCAFGVTTAFEASKTAAECSLLLPGWYAAARQASGEVTATAACPQNFYCPGGAPSSVFTPSDPNAFPAEATIQRCPSGTWTQERGAVTVEQCCKYAAELLPVRCQWLAGVCARLHMIFTCGSGH